MASGSHQSALDPAGALLLHQLASYELPIVGDGPPRSQQSGLLVEPGSASQIADALRSLESDGGLRSRLGAGASARADSFSVSAIGGRYLDLLDDILHMAGGRAT